MLVHSQVGILVCTPVVSRTFWVTVREIQQELLKGKGSSLADVKPWKMTGLGDWNQEAVTSLSAPLPCLASFSALPLSCAQFPDSHIATKWGGGAVSSSIETGEQSTGKPMLGHREGIPPTSLGLQVWSGAAVSTRTYQELPAASRFSALEYDLTSLHVLVNAQVWEPRPRGMRAAISGGLPLGFWAENSELSSITHQPVCTRAAHHVLVNAPGSLQEQWPCDLAPCGLGPDDPPSFPTCFPARCLSTLAPSLPIHPAFPPPSLLSWWLNLKL